MSVRDFQLVKEREKSIIDLDSRIDCVWLVNTSSIIKISPSIWEAQENGKNTDIEVKSKFQFWSKSVTFLEFLPKDQLQHVALMIPFDGTHISRFWTFNWHLK